MPSISDGLFAGRAGIQAHGAAISVVSDNVANANTVGFKASRAEFTDLLAGSISGAGAANLTAGSGSNVQAIRPIFNQGTFEITGRGLDLGINGDGFFMVDNAGARYYTRAGNFKIDTDGTLLNQNGYTVLGFPSNGAGGLQSLNVNQATLDNVETTAVTIGGNLDAGAPTVPLANIPPAPLTFANLSNTATYSTFLDVYDSLGDPHTMSIYYFKTPTAGEWQAYAYVDAGEVGGIAGTPAQVGTTTMTFGGDGQRTAVPPTGIDITMNPVPWSNGSNPGNYTLSMERFTQFSSPSGINSITQDGEGAGNIVSFSVDGDGKLFALLDNGQSSIIGTIALATFASPEDLQRVGGSLFVETTTSGEPVVGQANTGKLGSIASGSLELSTVDLASDFIKIITLQRGFQGSSRVIQSIDELLNEIISLA